MAAEFCPIKSKTFFMKSIKFVFLKAIVIVFLTFSAGNSFSQSPSESYAKNDAVNKVQFMGVEDDYLLFDLRFFELPAKGCTLRIMDDAGNTMFEETISGSTFMRRYKVTKEGMSRVSFKATGRGLIFNQSFTIKTEEKLMITTE